MLDTISHCSVAATYHDDKLPTPIRSPDDISADLVDQRRLEKRAWAGVLAPSRDGTIGGRRRDNRTLALVMVQKFVDKIKVLELELHKARCFEWWLTDVALRAGSWCEEEAWGYEGGEKDLVWEEAVVEGREDELVGVERIVRGCRWDT